LKKHLAGLAGN